MTPEEVLRAAAEWVWLPRDSEHTTGEAIVIRDPARFGGGVRASAFRDAGDAGDLVERIVERARGWGERRITFWVSDSSLPTGIEDALRSRGAEHVDTVTVLARDLAPLDVPHGVTVERVLTREQLRDVDVVNVAVWGQEPLDDAGLDAELRELEEEAADGRGLRVLARVDGRPAGTAGATLVDGCARLWGAATVEELRGRGVYRAVLAERLRLAAERGATTALVKGRNETSAPILSRAGFRAYGDERAWLLRLDA